VKQPNLQKARSVLHELETFAAHAHGRQANDDLLLEFRRLCWAALLLVDDAECHEQIDLLVQYAKDLYCDGKPDRVDALQGKIRAALGAFRARLSTLERGYGKRWRDLRAA
jgi:hypothetical protein